MSVNRLYRFGIPYDDVVRTDSYSGSIRIVSIPQSLREATSRTCTGQESWEAQSSRKGAWYASQRMEQQIVETPCRRRQDQTEQQSSQADFFKEGKKDTVAHRGDKCSVEKGNKAADRGIGRLLFILAGPHRMLPARKPLPRNHAGGSQPEGPLVIRCVSALPRIPRTSADR